MVFSSNIFLFLFFPIVLLMYYNPLLHGRKYRNALLLIASLLFYGWGEPVFVFLMIFSTLLTWWLGLRLDGSKAKIWLTIGTAYHVMVLLIFKYLGFGLGELSSLTGAVFPEQLLHIALPIGISFFTFQLMSYLFDIYYGKAEPQKSPLKVGLYVAFFPQLIAGPIVRYGYIAWQLEHRRESWNKVSAGLRRFIVGLGKKVLIADSMATIADYYFDMGTDMSIAAAWLGAIAYSLQIYFDFSGYSDMAIGLGRMFGFRFGENFNYPYMAVSVTDFWKRWHISLTSWFRDYVYIPLGGNRCSKMRWMVNFSVVWLLTGIWHGANWTFIAWGGIYLIVLLFERISGISRLDNPAMRIYTMMVVAMAWVVFRSENLGYAGEYLGSMVGLWGNPLVDMSFMDVLYSSWPILLIALVGSQSYISRGFAWLGRKGSNWVQELCLLAVFVLALIRIISSTYSPFIYFNF